MHPKDCPPFWEYNTDPKALELILARSTALLARLRTNKDACRDTALDTRPSHLEIFDGLPPESCKYLAGNFRGCDFKCLKHLKVKTEGDPMLGSKPELVAASMDELAAHVRETIETFDAPSTASPQLRLVQLATAVALHFEFFLTVHPFANGNGHMARLLVCAVFGRYDLWMTSWTVEPRPSDGDYALALYEHRRQRRKMLVKLILRHAKLAVQPAQHPHPAATHAAAADPGPEG